MWIQFVSAFLEFIWGFPSYAKSPIFGNVRGAGGMCGARHLLSCVSRTTYVTCGCHLLKEAAAFCSLDENSGVSVVDV